MEEIRGAVAARIRTLRNVPDDFSDEELAYYISKAEFRLKNLLGRNDIPDELFYVLVDMAAGMYLSDKKGMETYGSQPIKSISEGDTAVSYGTESEYDTLVKRLVNPEETILSRFRRISW